MAFYPPFSSCTGASDGRVFPPCLASRRNEPRVTGKMGEGHLPNRPCHPFDGCNTPGFLGLARRTSARIMVAVNCGQPAFCRICNPGSQNPGYDANRQSIQPLVSNIPSRTVVFISEWTVFPFSQDC